MEPTLTASAVLSLKGTKVPVELTVPSVPVPLRKVLPAVQSLTMAIIDQAEASEAAAGRHVSCKAGCGACCRQLVPIAEVEARMLRDMVETMPEPRRSRVLERFAEASRRLEAAGMREGLLDHSRITFESARTLGLEYFALGIACPFLEDESCSIHPDRPIVCREYLVTSPAEFCERPTAETVRAVPIAGEVSEALRKVGTDGSGITGPWVALSMALEWAAGHPDELPDRPGPAWLGEVVEHLTGRVVPQPPGG